MDVSGGGANIKRFIVCRVRRMFTSKETSQAFEMHHVYVSFAIDVYQHLYHSLKPAKNCVVFTNKFSPTG